MFKSIKINKELTYTILSINSQERIFVRIAFFVSLNQQTNISLSIEQHLLFYMVVKVLLGQLILLGLKITTRFDHVLYGGHFL